jgi:hypothetical protein
MIAPLAALLPLLALTNASPIRRWAYGKYFDLQGHRGGRGETVEEWVSPVVNGELETDRQLPSLLCEGSC